MKKYIYLLAGVVCIFQICCESDNIEEKYYKQPEPEIPLAVADTTDSSAISPLVQPRGEIAWFPLNGNLQDSTGNEIRAFVKGNEVYVDGMNQECGKGLSLDGTSCLCIDLGYYDTLSIVFWIKGTGALSAQETPVLFDYGLNSVSVSLDASSGATQLLVNKNGATVSSEESGPEALNSFEQYSFLYVEAGGDFTKVFFKGYFVNGDEKVYNDYIEFPGIIDPASELLYIGRSSIRDEVSNTYFKGAIDEIHIYSRSLTDQEVESFAFTHTE